MNVVQPGDCAAGGTREEGGGGEGGGEIFITDLHQRGVATEGAVLGDGREAVS
jgi:hypothetical protein